MCLDIQFVINFLINHAHTLKALKAKTQILHFPFVLCISMKTYHHVENSL